MSDKVANYLLPQVRGGDQEDINVAFIQIHFRTFHTYPICLPNFNFKKDGSDKKVEILYPKRNWENYQILYSLKVCPIYPFRCVLVVELS